MCSRNTSEITSIHYTPLSVSRPKLPTIICQSMKSVSCDILLYKLHRRINENVFVKNFEIFDFICLGFRTLCMYPIKDKIKFKFIFKPHIVKSCSYLISNAQGLKRMKTFANCLKIFKKIFNLIQFLSFCSLYFVYSTVKFS